MKSFLTPFPALFLILSLAATATAAIADTATIVAAKAERGADGRWRFDVTLAHPDSGWDHYANAWEVLGPDGTSLGVRQLAHPHVDEQPFTRTLSGVTIPAGVTQVAIRARCNMDGWASARYEIALGSGAP